ncbi:MAG: recombinase RecT [Candidatus Pristimantibacillus lignocellulolyticus]|uniref:Recombinase RecT n=1 Tax=Candidatus Pristimantibacillus lignocellulolyticus TaxID=2994561 RepID=A0A9J6ZED5_9BACL|nr:MAG: recombinase RecT [Candidatus Pristimantibacillus lignocellulolyticus]
MSEQQSQNQIVQAQQNTASQRFVSKVMQEFGAGSEIALTESQQRLARNYFSSISAVLSTAEINRMKKSDQYRDAVPVTWENVDLNKLSLDVVAYARLGLDPLQKNHLFPIPYKNNSTGKYDITFMEGYRGLELKAVKYGLSVPTAVIVELVYETDHFKPIKKDARNSVESYEFEVTNPFSRGNIIGGFYYHEYKDDSSKNKIVMMPIAEILKRKPEKASAEFWGGEKDEYKNGKKTGNKVQVDGWHEQMCYKTVFRAAHGDVTIDPQKIDADYHRIKAMETQAAEFETQQEIAQSANSEAIDVTHYQVVDDEQPTPTTVEEEEF